MKPAVQVTVFIDLPLDVVWIRRDGSIVLVERTAFQQKPERVSAMDVGSDVPNGGAA